MNRYQIIIDARDKFFFRDARPISGADIGEGANWPLPSVFHSALLSALSEAFPDTSLFESQHVNLTDKEKRKHFDKDGTQRVISNFRLGALKTWGIFPIKEKQESNKKLKEQIFVPTPSDIEPDGSSMKLLKLTKSSSNLPKPLEYLVINTSAPSKETLYPWISLEEFDNYLKGGKITKTIPNSEFYESEANPGIGIDPLTGSTEQGKFYQATYMKLKPNVSMLAFAECEAKKYRALNSVNLLKILFENKQYVPLLFGGQRAVAYMKCREEKTQLCNLIDSTPPINGNIVKWILLSPAIFNNGWRPDWVDNLGNVKLKQRIIREGETRKEWREKIKNAPEICAKLIAARIPKPVIFSGWKLDINADSAGGKPKATRLAVPAGSVYYFECNNTDEAHKLVQELHGNVKSSLLGEKGFGFGVCSVLKQENIVIT